MSSNTQGFKNENNIVNYLNNKTITELNDNMKNFIKFIFPNIKLDNQINAKTGKKGQKPDLEITCNGVTKYVSVKIGSGNSVHQEHINLFMNFLTTLKVTEETKNELLKFHWGDGTIDGTGKNRISSAEYKKDHLQEITLVNLELNNKEKLKKIIERILFEGKSSNYNAADYIYYGDIDNGHWASKEEIINYILSNNFKTDSIHFGPLSYQIWNRCLNFNPNTEDRRNIMQVKWASLLKDLINIEKERITNE